MHFSLLYRVAIKFSYWIRKVWFSSNLCWMLLSRWIRITAPAGPLPPLNLRKCQWLRHLQGWFVLAGRFLRKGVPPVHPKVFLPQEDTDVTKTARWVREKHQNTFRFQKANPEPSQIPKKTCNFWKLKCPATKTYCRRCQPGVCHAGYFLQRSNKTSRSQSRGTKTTWFPANLSHKVSSPLDSLSQTEKKKIIKPFF